MADTTGCHNPSGLRWACLPNEPLSPTLAPYGGIIMTAILIVLGLFKQFALEHGLLMRSRRFKKAYEVLNTYKQLTLVNHVMFLLVKTLLFAVAIYPFFRISEGHPFHTTFLGHLTLGDTMYFVTTLYTSLYLFELIYRRDINIVLWLHHIGAAIMAQIALVLSLQAATRTDASIYTFLAWVWGFFDLVSGATKHLAMIAYRLYPDDHPRLARWFSFGLVASAGFTVLETALILWFVVALRDRWTLVLKIFIPILHVLFSWAQCTNTVDFYGMRRKQVGLAGVEERGVVWMEAGRPAGATSQATAHPPSPPLVVGVEGKLE